MRNWSNLGNQASSKLRYVSQEAITIMFAFVAFYGILLYALRHEVHWKLYNLRIIKMPPSQWQFKMLFLDG